VISYQLDTIKPFLSVIIPVHNEAKRLPLTLVDIDRWLSRAEYSSEILVINDGSTDATAAIVERFAHLMPNLRLLNHAENRGKGWTVRQGMLQAHGNFRLFMDADNAVSVDQFDGMLPFLKEGYEVVIGSRTVKGAKLAPPQPLWRRLLGKGGNLFIQILAVPGIWDTQCGFKAFGEEAARKIFGAAVIDQWGFDVEALALARRFGFKIKEIPVRWANDPRSAVGGSAYFSTLRDVIRIGLKLRKGEYTP
jgi:dolichyl-phosphate beta-glucosyltransferase